MISEIHRNTQRLIVWCCLQSSCGRLSSQVASPLHCRIWRKAIVVESIRARACNSEHRSIPQHCSAARAACTRTCLECFGAPACAKETDRKRHPWHQRCIKRHQSHALELSLSLRSMRFSPVFQGNDSAARHQ